MKVQNDAGKGEERQVCLISVSVKKTVMQGL